MLVLKVGGRHDRRQILEPELDADGIPTVKTLPPGCSACRVTPDASTPQPRRAPTQRKAPGSRSLTAPHSPAPRWRKSGGQLKEGLVRRQHRRSDVPEVGEGSFVPVTQFRVLGSGGSICHHSHFEALFQQSPEMAFYAEIR